MEKFREISNFVPSENGCVLTVGVFDGLHRGHRAVIGKARELADNADLELVLLTFSPGPREFFSGTDEGYYILTESELVSELPNLGIDRLLMLPFDEKFREMSAEDFMGEYVSRRINTKALVVGSDFSFGYNREGNIDFIKSKGEVLGFEFYTVEEVAVDGMPVRSTVLREMIREGRIEEANHLLGYGFYTRGIVIPGSGTGKLIDCPTANMAWPRSKIKPKRGVYVVKAFIDSYEHPGVANFGKRPTITDGEAEDRLEVHIIDFQGKLVGREMSVKFISFVREEKKFPSIEELAEQVKIDISEARNIFTASKIQGKEVRTCR